MNDTPIHLSWLISFVIADSRNGNKIKIEYAQTDWLWKLWWIYNLFVIALCVYLYILYSTIGGIIYAQHKKKTNKIKTKTNKMAKNLIKEINKWKPILCRHNLFCLSTFTVCFSNLLTSPVCAIYISQSQAHHQTQLNRIRRERENN